MEEDEIQEQVSKFPRIENGTTFQSSSWHNNSSRIVRVSRASGGKDRHSKVMTSKGLRDRRVRLSVSTAIQFYDLQDRLGVDQPSKAVDWLIKAAEDAISELPSLNNLFPETPQQQSDHENQNLNQNLNSLSKSACSSNSETSKGSGGLSLSRCENRVKARERARERAAKEKENESSIAHNVNNNNHHHHMSQTASFTELLTGGIGSTVTVPTTTTTSPTGSVHQTHGGHHQWSSTVTPMDYFSSGLLMGHSSSRTHQSSSSSSSSPGFSGQIQLGHSLPVSPFSGENHSDQMQRFSFMPEHLMVTSSSCSTQPSGISDYNLNFTISPGLAAGYNRGTLQSNSPSLLPHHHHLQRFSSSQVDGSSSNNNLPFFMGGAAAAPATAPSTMENHHHLQFSPLFDGRLQLCYGDGSRNSDQKGKGKN